MKLVILLAVVLLAMPPRVSWGDSGLGFLYSRGEIVIVRKKLPPKLPWQSEDDSTAAVQFAVEIRDGANLYNPNIRDNQTGWFDLSGLHEQNGVMLFFEKPVMLPLAHSTEYAPLDVLFVDSGGIITQLFPSIRLSSLDHEIIPEKPVSAFVFLQGGVSQKLSITPGDKIDNALFKKSELIINKDKEREPAVTTAPLPVLEKSN